MSYIANQQILSTYFMHSLLQNPLLAQLQNAQNILLAGAGGGFDVYSAIPLYIALKAQGKNVHLANLSFSFLHKSFAEEVFSHCFKVDATPIKKITLDYFPEKYLSEWLKHKYQEDIPVYAFQKMGVVQIQNIYKYLTNLLQLDAIVLVDGGTDSLMFGDERGLGTPSEDFCSMEAVAQIDIPHKYLACLGFGIDHFHGVSHYAVLENIAKLSETNDYLGCFSVNNTHKEGLEFLSLVNYANNLAGSAPSIVCNSIKSAIEGRFGDYHATNRTTFSQLFINPLMNIYWLFTLEGIKKNNPVLEMITKTRSFDEIKFIINHYQEQITLKKVKSIPL